MIVQRDSILSYLEFIRRKISESLFGSRLWKKQRLFGNLKLSKTKCDRTYFSSHVKGKVDRGVFSV